MGRRPSRVVDVIELELMLGHTDFHELKRACEATLGHAINAGSLRVYWSYYKRYGLEWRNMMRMLGNGLPQRVLRALKT